MEVRDLSLATGFEQTIDNVKYIASFGIKSGEHIQLQENPNDNNSVKFSLQDFYNNWKDFRDSAQFIWSGTGEPQYNWSTQIRMYYNTNWN